MDKRIYAAFALHLKPVATASLVPPAPVGTSEFRMSDLHQKKDHPHLVLVDPLPAAAEMAPPSPSVSNQFVKLFTLLKKQRDPLLKWLGRQTYRHAQVTLRKTTKLKKGSMFDEKVE